MLDRFYFRFSSGSIAAAACALFIGATVHVAHAQDAALIQKGQYLATAGDCISCHTRPGGEPFSGGLPLKTPFGTIYTANITSDPDTGIGKWTEEQFKRAMREGVDNEGKQLYPAFPYPDYTKISDDDIHAIFAYVQSLKAVKYTPPKNEMPFPFGIRSLMMVWNKLFFQEGRYAPVATQSAEWNRGAYLVQGLGHCGACHTPRNSLGGPKNELALTGGSYLDDILDEVKEDKVEPLENVVRPWSAANLTSHTTGLKAWSADMIAAYLKTGHNSHAGAFGPMAQVVTNSTKGLSDEDTRAMAAYLKSLPAATQYSGAKIADDRVKAGENIYTVRCGDCHLPTGEGISENSQSAEKRSPSLVGNAVVQAPDPASLINVILYGAHEVGEGANAYPKMPGFAEEVGFDDDQVAALCDYLRSSWGNQGDACTAAQVAKQR